MSSVDEASKKSDEAFKKALSMADEANLKGSEKLAYMLGVMKTYLLDAYIKIEVAK